MDQYGTGMALAWGAKGSYAISGSDSYRILHGDVTPHTLPPGPPVMGLLEEDVSDQYDLEADTTCRWRMA